MVSCVLTQRVEMDRLDQGGKIAFGVGLIFRSIFSAVPMTNPAAPVQSGPAAPTTGTNVRPGRTAARSAISSSA